MEWTICNYTQSQVNRAGYLLTSPDSSPEEKEWARKVMNEWRSAHNYPLHSELMNLRARSATVQSDAIISQRLKRGESIIAKLENKPNNTHKMKLSRMQDIGGCRAVFSSIEKVYQLQKKYDKAIARKDIKLTDYIKNPKDSGYRSLHLIAAYKGSKKAYDKYKTEIQIRTQIQHAWATAVETVDRFTKHAIKARRGPANWNEFFGLVSSAFAKIENSILVPTTPPDPEELIARIRILENQLSVRTSMKHWQNAVRVIDPHFLKKAYYFLLVIEKRGDDTSLQIKAYPRDKQNLAIQAYNETEQAKEGAESLILDVVLVALDSVNELRKAYPNYYSDTTAFVAYLEQVMHS